MNISKNYKKHAQVGAIEYNVKCKKLYQNHPRKDDGKKTKVLFQDANNNLALYLVRTPLPQNKRKQGVDQYTKDSIEFRQDYTSHILHGLDKNRYCFVNYFVKSIKK